MEEGCRTEPLDAAVKFCVEYAKQEALEENFSSKAGETAEQANWFLGTRFVFPRWAIIKLSFSTGLWRIKKEKK